MAYICSNYILCILSRFIYLASLSGDYLFIFIKYDSSNSILKYIKKLTCFSLIKSINCSFFMYSSISIIILIIFIFQLIMNYNFIKKFSSHTYGNKWPFPSRYRIIIDHLNFLFFPQIIEFLSFSYYMIFFRNAFIIKVNNNYILLFFLIIINTALMIYYNIDNYINIICSNRIHSITNYEAYKNMNQNLQQNQNN